MDTPTANAIEILKTLVAYPTVSTDSNLECTGWIQEALERRGFETEFLSYIDENRVEKGCVVGRLGSLHQDANDSSGLAWFCHNDVVPATTWTFPKSGPWQATEYQGRIYGRGSCDMKGSLACLLAAIDQQPGPFTSPLYVACTSDEEIGYFGARHLTKHSQFYDEIRKRQVPAVIGEPTSLHIVHGHKGGQILTFTAHGKAAHSSTDAGINANLIMIPFLSELHQLVQRLEGNDDFRDQRFDPPGISLNLTLSDGQSALNITPPESRCSVYYRTLPGMDVPEVNNQLIQLAEAYGLRVEHSMDGHPMWTDPDSAFVHELLQLAGQSSSQTVSYGTDASCLTDLTQLAVVGPGSILQAHTDDEWISIDQLRQGTQFYAKLIHQRCC